MQISPPSLPIATAANTPSHGPDKSSAQTTQQSPVRQVAQSLDTSPPQAAETLSLSAAATANLAASEVKPTTPVYAEIWKGPVKVAQVDIYGHVESFAGPSIPDGGSLTGHLLAAQRTVQMAQLTGGEIRTAGQTLDSQTLLMRARLASAYTQ